ncbi:MAG TPA: hypothetical protein GXZ90_03935 [Clostridiales bacterium]|nr:hypothetical protein [Clostridiales bacterium]
MNKNIMCVGASGDTANIGFYDVDVFENKIDTVRLEDWRETFGLNVRDVAGLIYDLCDGSDYYMIIIDCAGIGIGIADELEKTKEFTTPVYKTSLSPNNINNGVINTREYINNNKLIIDEDIDIDLSKFSYKHISPHGGVRLDVDISEKEFSNIVQFFSFIEICLSDYSKIKNKTIIEKNLHEIVDILINDLSNADTSNVNTINNLARLIDKVNYIRKQYK